MSAHPGPHPSELPRRAFLTLAAGAAASGVAALASASRSTAFPFPSLDGEPAEGDEPTAALADELWRDYTGRLCYNENPRGPSPLAIAAITGGLDLGHRYGDWFAESLRQDLASLHQVSAARVRAGAGGTEMLRLCALAFARPGKNVVVPTPSYEQFGGDCAMMGAAIRYVPLDADRIDLGAMLAQVDSNTAAVGLTNPNNPTATVLSAASIAAFMNALPAQTVVVIDEAYHEYVQDPGYASAVDLVRQGKNVVVIRTFSKVFGMAGIRVGYAVGHTSRMGEIGAWQIWGTVSRPASDGARAALADAPHVSASLADNEAAKAYCYAELAGMALDVIPSQTNFFMVDVRQPAGPVASQLAARGILVRTGWGMQQHLRVSIGLMEEMQAFIAALRDILGITAAPDAPAPDLLAPAITALWGNFPNPATSETRITYSIAAGSRARLRLFDAHGRLVRTLVDGTRDPGHYEVSWNGHNEAGQRAARGCYFYRLEAGEVTETRRLILL